MRIYLPATAADLSRYPDSALEPVIAFAATPGLAAALPGEDDEAVEFSAFLAAADTAVELLVSAQAAAGPVILRRVVVTADVVPASVRPDRDHGHPGAVVVTRVDWSDIVAVHLDETDAAPDVELALNGDEVAAERLSERDLLWYDASEIGRLAAGLP